MQVLKFCFDPHLSQDIINIFLSSEKSLLLMLELISHFPFLIF